MVSVNAVIIVNRPRNGYETNCSNSEENIYEHLITNLHEHVMLVFALKTQQKPGFLFLSYNNFLFYSNFTNQTIKACHSHILLHFCILI